LHNFDRNARAFPTPRAWSFVSRIIGQNPKADTSLALYCGAVGDSAGNEFTAFLRMYQSLPSIDSILLNPDKANVPDEPSTRYAVASALARRVKPDNIGRVLTYLDRMPQEYAVCAVKDATVITPAINSTREFTSWAIQHSDVCF
jgi:hypothetical protein